MVRRIFIYIVFILAAVTASAQNDSSAVQLPVKISHAEPLYIDLIRDLGARRGEREWNAGWGINDEKETVEHTGFAEYEFSPMNRLGLEAEIPFTVSRRSKYDSSTNSSFTIDGIKLAAQYTLLVSPKRQLSLAVGHIYELEFNHSLQSNPAKAQVFNPFFIAAKRWGQYVHTLVYTGPLIAHDFGKEHIDKGFQCNVSIHYVMPQTRNFIGLEINHEHFENTVQTTLRPQIKLNLTSKMALGFATGIPLTFSERNLSFLTRLVYEPQPKKR